MRPYEGVSKDARCPLLRLSISTTPMHPYKSERRKLANSPSSRVSISIAPMRPYRGERPKMTNAPSSGESYLIEVAPPSGNF
ncbi:hypothetical protein C4D60_Mb06t34350 [Musa balbisiana]|uniref:Uncharacterized protein n=1 Tax=Musa balbisiana TaxID=52838 RepID=A0A4S8IV83_MUSBA|nr:hypothetical protein C4D60_Mb06t34350 [Musa balbisiana]